MPAEESGNMFLMLAGIVQRLNTTDFLEPYWNIMENWAQFLHNTLPDPNSQLCPDNFVCNLYFNFYKDIFDRYLCFRENYVRITAI